MEVFATPKSKYYHIVKERINNPPFPYNSQSVKIQAYCHVNCNEINVPEFITIDPNNYPQFICPKCLERYNKNNA